MKPKMITYRGNRFPVKGTGISSNLHQSLYSYLQKNQAMLRLAEKSPAKEFGGNKGKLERIKYLKGQVKESRQLTTANTVNKK